jgi:hypothetical protein
MNDDNTVETYADDANPNVRVRLVRDTDADSPDGDAYAPAILIGARGGLFRSIRAEYVGSTYQTDALDLERLAEAWERWGDRDKVTRWLRMFQGVTTVETIDTDGDVIVILDTPDYRRDCVGPSDDDLPENLLAGDVEAWRAWLEGDVYGIITERRVTTHTTVTDAATGEVVREDDDDDVWEEYEAVWGFYGREYAEQEAQAIFRVETTANDA